MRLLFLSIITLSLAGCSTTLFCTRVGGDYQGDFVCTDKGENFMTELDLDKLRGKKVPKEWARAKITFYQFYPLLGHSIWPLWGYSMKDYSRQYNDGSEMK